MKRRSLIRHSVRRAAASTTSTGEHCPETGWWIPQGSAEPWRYLGEGSVMPALNGRPAVWVRAATDKMPEQRAAQAPSRSLSPA